MPLRTPLYDFHISMGAKMVEYAGWEMPILYRGIAQEHQQTRQSGSMFDVSHMGRIQITGKAAIPFLNKVLTRNVAEQRVGQSRYSLACSEAGGILDDLVVSKHARHWLVVCNASNREKILKHLVLTRDGGSFEAEIADQTEATAMVAIQGPKVIDLLSDTLEIDLKQVKRWGIESGTYLMAPYSLFRSGYTGEDGAEVVMSGKSAATIIQPLVGEMSKPDAVVKPAGLGARDSLRLEAAMPLYEHELNEGIDPISADLAWAVDLKKDFIGSEALRAIASRGPTRKLVGLELQGPRIARQDSPVMMGSAAVGIVTSGTLSPTLQKSIAMAYVDAAHAAMGTELAVDLRGTAIAAKIVALPFYKRTQ